MTSAGIDERFFERSMRRIGRISLVLAGTGTAAAWMLAGWRGGAGFLLGAAASVLNFRWLKQAAEALGPESKPARKRTVAMLGLRYLLFGAVGYTAVRWGGVSMEAALAGLAVAVAAVLAEMVYQLASG